MKKYLLLLLAACCLVACEDTFDVDEVMNEYSFEQLNALTEGFEASDIDYDQLVADLTTYTIFTPRPMGTWFREGTPDAYLVAYEKTEGCAHCPWCEAHLGRSKVSVCGFVFNEDGTAAYLIWDHTQESFTATNFMHSVPLKWVLDKEKGEIVCEPQIPLRDRRWERNELMDASNMKFVFQIRFSREALLIYDLRTTQPIYDYKERYKIDLSKQVLNTETWPLAKDCFLEEYDIIGKVACQNYKPE